MKEKGMSWDLKRKSVKDWKLIETLKKSQWKNDEIPSRHESIEWEESL